MERRGLARAVLRAAGLALMAAGAIHLIATPEIPHLLDGLSPKARSLAIGPTLLNHVLVGILLVPLGFTTWMAATGHYHLRQTWARPVIIVNSLAAFALPLTLVLFIGQPDYRAPLFLAAAALTVLAAVSIPIGALIGGSTTSAPG